MFFVVVVDFLPKYSQVVSFSKTGRKKIKSDRFVGDSKSEQWISALWTKKKNQTKKTSPHTITINILRRRLAKWTDTFASSHIAVLNHFPMGWGKQSLLLLCWCWSFFHCSGKNLHVLLQVCSANVCRREAVVPPVLASHRRKGK